MSAEDLRAQVDAINTRISSAQYFLMKADNELKEIAQELLALDLSGSRSHHVASANRLLPIVLEQFRSVPFDLSLIHSEMLQYRNVL